MIDLKSIGRRPRRFESCRARFLGCDAFCGVTSFVLQSIISETTMVTDRRSHLSGLLPSRPEKGASENINGMGSGPGELVSSEIESPLSSTMESTAPEALELDGGVQLNSSYSQAGTTKNLVEDNSLVMATRHVQKRSAPKKDILEDTENAEANRSHTLSRVDDRFGSALNVCDALGLQTLRSRRFCSPIVIQEEDDEEDNELWSSVVRTDVHLKAFLHSPKIHRSVCGWDGEVAPFVVQNIGFIHPKVPHVFIAS